MNEYHQLPPERRYTIYRLKKEEYPQRKIAQIIDVHPSTLSHELKINTGGRRHRGYKQAQTKAGQRRSNAKKHIK